MKTFKHIAFNPCDKVQGVKAQIEIKGQVVSIISGLWTQGSKIDSPLVGDHWSFEVAVWEAKDPSKWTTKKWVRDAIGIQCPIKGGMNRRQINALMKRIQNDTPLF